MRLRRIEIRNFRAHEKSVVEFNDGINLIIGQNGAGKSSILEAVFASLYLGHPSFPRGYQAVNTRVGSSGFSLKLEFEHEGKTYILERTSTKSVLRENGAIIADKSSEIARWVEKNVYPIQVFTNALYIRQGEIEGIITNREIMEKVLRKVLGIEDYENAEKNAAEVIRELRRKKEYLRKTIERKEEVQKNLEDAEKRFSETLKKIGELRRRVRELEGEVEELEKKYEEMKELKEELTRVEQAVSLKEKTIENEKTLIEELKRKKTELEGEVKELEKKLKRLEELEGVEKEYTELRNLLSLKDEVSKVDLKLARLTQKLESLREKAEKRVALDEKLKKLREREAEIRKSYEELKEKNSLYLKALGIMGEIEKYRRELKRAGYTLEGLEKELQEVEDARRKLEKIRENIGKIRENIAELRARKNELLQNLRKIEGAKVCPLCKRPIEEHDEEEIKREYDLELSRIEGELSGLSARLEEMTKLEKELRKKVEAERKLLRLKKTAELLKEAEEKLKEMDVDRLENYAREFERTKDELIGIKKEINHVKKELEEVEKAETELENVERLVSSLETKRDKLIGKLKERGFESFDAVEKRLGELEPLHREYLSLRDVPETLKKTRKKLEETFSAIEAKKKRLEELQKELEELKDRLRTLSNAFSKEDFSRIESEYLEKMRELERTRTELREGEKLRDEIGKLINELRGRLKEIESAENDLKKVETLEGEIKAFREKVARLKAEAEVRGLAEVERLAGETFSEMTEGKYQGIKLKREKKYGRERIELKVLYAGNEVGTDFLSGGERIALGLAFRLALSLYKVDNLELLILDEPTPFLDEERRKKLIEIISNQLRKIPQVIIVSHDEELKDAADYVIRVTNVGGKSRVEVESLGAY
ncbi:DNA double-strand break repair ATPase Rad50 [Thermococcus sp.]